MITLPNWLASRKTLVNRIEFWSSHATNLELELEDRVRKLTDVSSELERVQLESASLQRSMEELIEAIHDRDETGKENIAMIEQLQFSNAELQSQVLRVLAQNERLTKEVRVQELVADTPEKKLTRRRKVTPTS